ncbi:hypothetical protein BDY21DRAFT_71317 [Lineolata rhizophorae]|uniref:Uncharacterized protein n=1 Tax=Lineolata rhizophorae TaxID=578093 RepID=A0A6A6NVB6_9PEZI|nr:hypothetical protein BDY21DRAFT_71317 [Lineolata rhizophorae]
MRYHQPQDVSAVVEAGEHAFLWHAATFWYWYLSFAVHPEELFDEVVGFIHSPAFWTCVAVQSCTTPHLFARFTRVADRGYRIEHTSPKPPEDADVNYAIPLPTWLDEYLASGLRFI